MNIKNLNTRVKNKFPLTVLSLSFLAIFSCYTVQAEPADSDEHSFWDNRGKWYFGVGYYDHDFEDVVLDGALVESDSGFGLSLGGIKPLKRNIDLEFSINVSTSDGATIGTGTCSTQFGGSVSCKEKASTTVWAVPIVFNYRFDATQNLAFHIGAGGALTYVSRELELTASGFQSKTTADERGFTVSPYAQAGFMYKRIRLNYALNNGASDDDTGDGDSSSISIEYFW